MRTQKITSFMFFMVALVSMLSLSGADAWSYDSNSSGRLGLGAILGEPTGFTGKYWQDTTHAIDGGMAYSFSDFFLTYVDYLWHFKTEPSLVRDHLAPYIGVGGELFVSTQSNRKNDEFFTEHGSVGFGVRVPIGLEWTPPHTPIGIYGELAPGVGIVPATFGFLQGGVGARFYF
jgi:hypothetical protein